MIYFNVSNNKNWKGGLVLELLLNGYGFFFYFTMNVYKKENTIDTIWHYYDTNKKDYDK